MIAKNEKLKMKNNSHYSLRCLYLPPPSSPILVSPDALLKNQFPPPYLSFLNTCPNFNKIYPGAFF